MEQPSLDFKVEGLTSYIDSLKSKGFKLADKCFDRSYLRDTVHEIQALLGIDVIQVLDFQTSSLRDIAYSKKRGNPTW